MTDKLKRIEVASIYGFHSREGLVELTVDGAKVQMDIRKTREVITMLQEAAEAAISDQMLLTFLQTKMSLTLEQAGGVLLDFREIRQGGKKVVYIQ